MSLAYITLEQALRTHDTVLEISGGLAGVKHIGAVESILEHIQNDDYYPDFVSKLTHLVFSTIKHHAFNDGNKRTSIALGSRFLLANGYTDACVSRFTVQMEDVAVAVAEGGISKENLQHFLQDFLQDMP